MLRQRSHIFGEFVVSFVFTHIKSLSLSNWFYGAPHRVMMRTTSTQ